MAGGIVPAVGASVRGLFGSNLRRASKMNFDLVKLGKTASVLFLALAMAGCGGGGTAGPVDPPPPTAEEERMMVASAIEAAETAVGGLTGMSTDEDVAAAEMAITAANTALSGVLLLSGSEVLELRGEIATVQMSLDTANMTISNYRTHSAQLMAANDAVDDAEMAVGGLTAMSTDADLQAAQDAIDAAEMAVTAGTMLTTDEVAMLNGDIATAKMDLATATTTAMNFRTHAGQLMAATGAVGMATDAVDALTAMSTDDEVAAAKTAIATAEAMVAAGLMLTSAEIADLNGKIAIAKVDLGTIELAITGYRTHRDQLAEANSAVTAAEMAIAALDINSTDAEVTDAENKVAAAKMAVMDGTTLTADEVLELNGKIAAAEVDLGSVKEQVAIRKAGETSQQIVNLHQDASDATKAATDAGADAAQAVKDAAKYSDMLDVASVKGDSYDAQMNAQKVLDADDAVDQAVMNAEKAKTDAETAKTEAEAIADGTTGKTEVVAALDAAIAAAEVQIAATKAIDTAKNADDTVNQDGVNLKADVEMVTGTDKDDLKTATDVGEGVAMAVGGALLPTVPDTAVADHDGTARRVTHYDAVSELPADAPALMERTFYDNDSSGMTWSMIVGEANVARERIGTDDAVRLVAPISGEAMDFDTDGSALSATGGTDGAYSDAYATPDGETDINYKGIPGRVFCLGGTDGCSVNADGDLVGGWYFSPTSTTNVYIADADGTGYVQDTGFVSWGHWLTTANPDGTGDVTIHTYATSAANTASLALGVATASETEFETATYSGDAAGMSIHKTFDDDGKQVTIYSGAFTADVSLTARFGASPTLKGTVSNFQSASSMNTDPDWSVALRERALAATATFTDVDGSTLGVAKGSGQAGDWSTQGFGPAPIDHDDDPNTALQNQRPTGFFGNFEAHFTDGHAAGAYATRD